MKITRERTRLFARLMASGAVCAALFGFASHAQAQTTLRVWTRSNPDARTTYDNIAAAFTKKTGIKVEYFNAMTDYEQRLSRAIAGNDLPDVIINDSSSLGLMMKTGVATEIDRAGFPGSADIQDRAWQGAQGYNGKYYAVPVSVQSFVFFIRFRGPSRQGRRPDFRRHPGRYPRPGQICARRRRNAVQHRSGGARG